VVAGTNAESAVGRVTNLYTDYDTGVLPIIMKAASIGHDSEVPLSVAADDTTAPVTSASTPSSTDNVLDTAFSRKRSLRRVLKKAAALNTPGIAPSSTASN
jgi:hypothetical protein